MFSPWLIYECTTRLPWHKLSQTWMLWIYVERLGNKFIHFFMSFVIIFFLLFPFNADIFWRCIAINLMWKIWLIEICFFFDYRAVTDPRDGRRVALKKLPNVFQSLVSSKRVFRELKMLCFFKHENVSWRLVSLTHSAAAHIYNLIIKFLMHIYRSPRTL